MNTEFQAAQQPLETHIPESLFSQRCDIELARTHKEVCEAAAKAMREVASDTHGYIELMAYALARVQETKGL